MGTETLSIVIAISFGVFSIVGVMTALFLWNRGESNNDRRHHHGSIEGIRRDVDRIYARLNKLDKRK
jgi:heme/copper-type cytochrome/quinol oxidase subunit 2